MTAKLPPVKMATPSNSEAVLDNSAAFEMLQVVDDRLHPGPSKTTVALLGSKSTPVMENVNACAFTGGLGEVVIART